MRATLPRGHRSNQEHVDGRLGCGRIVQLVLSAGVLAVLGVSGTTAAWTDPATVSGTVLSTATIDLKVDNSDSVTGYTALNLTKMEPGDSTAAVVTVKNAGSAPVSYYLDATASGTLAASLTARVTTGSSTTGSSPSVTCNGTVVPGSGSTFTSNLISPTSPIQLAAGASASLCLQATLPNGSVAQGASATLGFTFRAFTGSSAAPGWTDPVSVAGTSLSAATAWYLGGNPGSNTTSSAVLPLKMTGPTQSTVYNYDTDDDAQPGLGIKNNASPSGRTQTWAYPTGSTPLTLSGTSKLRIASALPGFVNGTGSMQVSLLECDASGSSCTTLVTSTSGTITYSGGDWVRTTIPIVTTPSSRTWPAGRSLGLQITNIGATDLMLAYDTTSYRGALFIE